jgi:PAS domain S-box-containing protein
MSEFMTNETAKREVDKELIYNRVFETPIVGMTVLDMNQNIIFGNATARKIFQLEQDAVGVNVREFLNEESKKLIDTVVVPALEKTGSWQGELVGKRKDGREVPLSASCIVIYDEEGKPHAVLATYRDITERKEMENSLRESEKRYRRLVDAAPDVIYTIAWDGTITSLNPAFERITGWSRSEWLNKHFAELVHPDDLNKAVETFHQAMRGETPPPYELRIKTKSGDYLVGEFISTPLIEKGEIVGELGIARDITEHKKAEDALRESNEKFKALYKSGPIPSYTWQKTGEDFVLVDYNDAAAAISGKVAGLIGIKAKEMYKDRPDIIEDLKRCYIEHTTVRREMFHQFSTGTRKFLVVTYTFVPPNFVMVYTEDITERKRAEDKLREYSEKLEQKVEEKTKELIESEKKLITAEKLAAIGEVATQVGHDLRNPLTSIKGAAYYLKTKAVRLDKNAKKMFDTIDASIEYANKIITDLLDFSQEIKLKPVRRTVKEVVTGALSSIKIPKKVEVIDSTESELTIQVDPLLIKRVLHNIFTNAFDAMPDGGTLKIESKENDKNVSIKICDSGAGMPKKVLEKVFTPFFTTKAKGVGLGLAICKRIVEAHEGSISIESKVGKGTCVTIILPKK